MSIDGYIVPTTNIQQSTPGNPGGTGNLTQLMMGLAISFTPKYSGKIKVEIQADMLNNTTNDGCTFQGRYGTSTAPINGANPTGTTIGKPCTITALLSTSIVTVTQAGYITGLTPGTVYWFDVGLAAITGGTASIQNVVYILTEYNA